MSKPPTPDYPTKLKIRAYECRASAVRIKAGLEKLLETSLAFNECWLLGEFDEGSRIGGLNQHGDIIVRHTSRRPKSELTIEYRAGDEALALVIEATFGKFLTPKAPRMGTGSRRPAGLAYFFEMFQSCPVRRQVVVADAVIEEAHDLAFDDYQECRAKLEFLRVFPRLGVLQTTWDTQILQTYAEAKVRHPKPKICLFEGKKVALRHKVQVRSKKQDHVLVLHFAKLGAGRVLVGWVEELAS